MPWHVTNDNPDCNGWAVVKDSNGEIEGCHTTKAAAEAQLTALNIAEYGDRSVRALPDNYRPAVSDDVPDGRACGNCAFYDDDIVNEDGVRVWCALWRDWVRGDHYCNRWQSDDEDDTPETAYGKDKEDDKDSRQVSLNLPDYIRSAAARGLELRADGFGGDGLTEGTIREARDMAAGRITEDKVIRASAWGARHAVDLQAPKNSDAGNDEWPGPGAVAHYLWGINPLSPDSARAWFDRKAEQIKAERSRMNDEQITDEFRLEAPKDNLTRQVTFRAVPDTDGRTLEGYAAVFNEWTTIDSWEGTFQERIAPGAFKKTLSERMPVLQFDHGTHPLIGSIPLGVFTALREDENGLFVRGRLSDNWLVEPIRDAIRDGAITGMSFRFRVIKDSWRKGAGNVPERTIQEIALYEAGPVVFPAYEQTSVSVRSREVLTALNDEGVRHELALMLATGTTVDTVAADDDAPGDHATRSKSQRRAMKALHNL